MLSMLARDKNGELNVGELTLIYIVAAFSSSIHKDSE